MSIPDDANITDSPESVCPIHCPNRRINYSERERGKFGGYVFSVVCLILAMLFSFKVENGHWEPKDEVPVLAWAILLPMAGLGLGVQVDAEAIGKLIGRN